MLKLIVEDNDYTKATVVESTEEELKEDRYHPLVMRGIFARADAVNRNKRFYGFNMLKQEMDKFIKEKIEKNKALGELEHPDYNEMKPEKVACKIMKLTCDEPHKCWVGEARILYSDPKHNVTGFPRADIAKALLDAGVPLGFSTRGCGELHPYTGSFDGIDTGDLTNEDLREVKEVRPWNLSQIDVVSEPSVGVYCDGILESKSFMVDVHGRIVECAFTDYEKALSESTHTNILEKKQKIYKDAFDNFLKKIG